jgi:hypothetical protein
MSQGDYIPEPIKMVKREDWGSPSAPLITLNDAEAQALIDALWNAGLRPSCRGSESGIVEAKDAHIGDLRSLLNRITGDLHAGTA